MKVFQFSGRNLARAREAAGLTRTELAAKIGFSEQSVYLWEKYNRRPGSTDTISLLASALGVEPGAFYERVERRSLDEVAG